MKVAFHIHTAYSHDGHCALEKLHEKAVESGYGYLVITDHFEDLSEAQIQELVDLCNEISSPHVGLIPGVEVVFEGKAHVLVIGLNGPLRKSDTVDIDALREAARLQNALIGVAHLGDKCSLTVDELSKFDFIEAWNYRHNKGFPLRRNLETVQRIDNVCILGGLDLHMMHEFGGIWNEIETGNPIDAIRNKRIISRNYIVEIDASGRIRNKATYYLLYPVWSVFISTANIVKKVFRLKGKRLPPVVRKISKLLLG